MGRGGYREGAGRPLGSSNKCTTEQSQRLSELAKTYTEEALLTLADVARNGRTDAARVSAANALLDRAYGKPPVDSRGIFQKAQSNQLILVLAISPGKSAS